MENDEAHSVVLCGPLSSCCRTGRLDSQSAILSHTFTFLPPPYAQSDPLISPPCCLGSNSTGSYTVALT